MQRVNHSATVSQAKTADPSKGVRGFDHSIFIEQSYHVYFFAESAQTVVGSFDARCVLAESDDGRAAAAHRHAIKAVLLHPILQLAQFRVLIEGHLFQSIPYILAHPFVIPLLDGLRYDA